MNNSQKPLARKDNLVIQEMPDEVLVYDLNTNKAHCLNQTAAFVWKACDGVNTVSDISDLFSKQTGNLVQEDLVWLAIDQLNEKNLLNFELSPAFQGETRRNLIKKIGLAAVISLPVVASLTAPTSVLAVGSCACGAGGNPATCSAQSGCPTSCNGGTGACVPPPPPISVP